MEATITKNGKCLPSCDHRVKIKYDEPNRQEWETLIDIALAEHDGKSEWFHSISDEEAYSYFISFTTAQKRNNKLNELGI